MRVSHTLSEKAVKKLDLDKIEKTDFKNRKVVKEWNTHEEYWKEWEQEHRNRNKKWYVKVANFFKYSIGWRLRDWWWNLRWYISNIRTFKPILKTWRSYDYHFQIDLFKFGLKQLAEAMEYYGGEEEISRKRRIEAINALISEIDRDYEEDVQKRLNYNFHERAKVTKYDDGSVCFHNDETPEREQETARYFDEIKKERLVHYKTIFDLIIGQDGEWVEEEVKRIIKELPEEEKKSMSDSELWEKVYYQVWDGSGIEGWWD